MAAQGNLKLGRRNFLRVAGLGAGAATLATMARPAAVQAAPRIKEAADAAGRNSRPWWVRTVDEPTTEIDWEVMQRYNERTGTVRGPGMAGYVGADEVDRLEG